MRRAVRSRALGKARPFGSNDLQQFAAIDRALRAAVSEGAVAGARGRGDPGIPCDAFVDQTQRDFKLHLDDDTANFTAELKPGMLLCEQPQEDYRVAKRARGYCSP